MAGFFELLALVEGAELGERVLRVANLQALHALHESLAEGFIDRALHEDSRACGTHLSLREVVCQQRIGEGAV